MFNKTTENFENAGYMDLNPASLFNISDLKNNEQNKLIKINLHNSAFRNVK